MATFQLYWRRKTLGAPPCIISGTSKGTNIYKHFLTCHFATLSYIMLYYCSSYHPPIGVFNFLGEGASILKWCAEQLWTDESTRYYRYYKTSKMTSQFTSGTATVKYFAKPKRFQYFMQILPKISIKFVQQDNLYYKLCQPSCSATFKLYHLKIIPLEFH